MKHSRYIFCSLLFFTVFLFVPSLLQKAGLEEAAFTAHADQGTCNNCLNTCTDDTLAGGFDGWSGGCHARCTGALAPTDNQSRCSNDEYNDYLNRQVPKCDLAQDICWATTWGKNLASGYEDCRKNVAWAYKKDDNKALQDRPSCWVPSWIDNHTPPATQGDMDNVSCRVMCSVTTPGACFPDPSQPACSSCRDTCLAQGSAAIATQLTNSSVQNQLKSKLAPTYQGNPADIGKGLDQMKGGFEFGRGTSFQQMGRDILTSGYILVALLAVLKIIFGGVMYATAAGNPQRITEAKSHITYALIGIALIVGMNVLLFLIGADSYY